MSNSKDALVLITVSFYVDILGNDLNRFELACLTCKEANRLKVPLVIIDDSKDDMHGFLQKVF